jgi:hypothetical protein
LSLRFSFSVFCATFFCPLFGFSEPFTPDLLPRRVPAGSPGYPAGRRDGVTSA